MGADEKSNFKKCGEIFINLNKARNRNNKMYMYYCALCNANCDQLKKLTLHLEETHLQQFTYEEAELFEPDIKIEEQIKIEEKNDLKNDNINETVVDVVHEDPLIETIAENIEELLDVKLRVKNEIDCNEQNINYENVYNTDEMDYEDCIEDDDSEDFKPIKKRNKKIRPSKKSGTSDLSSDDSNDVNVSVKANKKKKSKRRKKSQPDINVEEKEFIKALFEAFEKQTNLWNIKERTTDKNVCQKGFETIANEVNEKLKTNITWKLAKIRINAMRSEYSLELVKQRKGEEHQIPWYFEHMHYLQENIDLMIKERHRSLDRRMKQMDLSLLPIIIKLYKKYDDLWKVKNINFGIAAKRDESFTKMAEELKLDHNLHMNANILQDYIKCLNRLYSKDKELQLKCESENSEFIPTSKFYSELSFLSESQKPFKCATCKEIFHRYDNYHIHVANHNNTKPFNCPLCKMGFKTFDTYVKHAKRHLRLKSFHCNVCGKVYPLKTELERHLIGHTGEKPFLCQICGTSFRVSRDYDNHIRRHEKRFRYECHICKHGFNQLASLNDHVKSHLKIRDAFCDVCGKGFTTEKYLKNHKLIHDDTKRFKCDVCDKEFSQLAGLRQHSKQHRQQKRKLSKNLD